MPSESNFPLSCNEHCGTAGTGLPRAKAPVVATSSNLISSVPNYGQFLVFEVAAQFLFPTFDSTWLRPMRTVHVIDMEGAAQGSL
jgi:hypothetical protein